MVSDYFKNLLHLLQQEKEADLQAFLKVVKSSSLAEKREAGLLWYPVAIRNIEPTFGDYLSIELERTTHTDLSHQFRSGASAILFSNHQPNTDHAEGILTFQSVNRLKLTLRVDEMPEWAKGGKLGVELLFDNKSYDEMTDALKSADKSFNEGDKLVRVLTGQAEAFSTFDSVSFSSSRLNTSQVAAVKNVLTANPLAIIHGPPGTGKTTALVEAIKALLDTGNRRILVTAPSNTAVDLLAEKLANGGVNVIRIGNPARVSASEMELTLDHQVNDHASMREVRTLKKQANELRSMAHKYKRNFGPAERQQRKALFEEAHKMLREADNIERYIVDDLLNKAQVVAATLVGANHHSIKSLHFDTVVIDEAGQALEPACWIPILKGNKLVLAGDPFQLPPTLKSDQAARNGLALTLLEKCIHKHREAVILLNEQYRMNNVISRYPSKMFYDDRLVAHFSVADRLAVSGDKPLVFLDTAGCGFDEVIEGTSLVNPEEATLLLNHLRLFVAQLALSTPDFEIPSIGIISPYREQVGLLKELLAASDWDECPASRLSVNTIDGFQGQERDVVYISMVRSNREGTVGFLSDIRRMNVAMTRARKKLVVIGDSATLSTLPFYADFISYAEQVEGYQSAWEFT